MLRGFDALCSFARHNAERAPAKSTASWLLFGFTEPQKSLRGGSVPVAKCETLSDKAADIDFRASGFIPDGLDYRIIPARHTVDRIVLASNLDDYSAGTLTT
jgi:hypothetical protein